MQKIEGLRDRHAKTGQLLGSSRAEIFRRPGYDCRVVDADLEPEFAVTRLRSGPREMVKAPTYPRSKGVLICVSLAPAFVGQWRAVYNGRQVGVTRAIPFATTYIDLCRPMEEMWVRGPFDYLHYYLSRTLLERIALDNGVEADFDLKEGFFVEDLVVAEMTKSILAPVAHGEPLDRLALDQVSMVLGAHMLQAHCDTASCRVSPKSSLEPWQKLRAEEMLRAHLEENISVRELAVACSLSESHFARCFRASFGTSVHQRLIQLRIERAKCLLTEGRESLGQIALLSGFCDQAAFTRTFTRLENMSPSRWRRFNSGDKTPKRNVR